MRTVKEKLRALVEQVPPEKEERALQALRHIVDCPPATDDATGSADFDELMRRHLKEAAHRVGLDVNQLPQNGGWSGGVIGDRVEFTKDWVSEDARHRLSKLDVKGNDVILLERIAIGEGAELRYEVRVFAEPGDGRAEVNIRVGR